MITGIILLLVVPVLIVSLFLGLACVFVAIAENIITPIIEFILEILKGGK